MCKYYIHCTHITLLKFQSGMKMGSIDMFNIALLLVSYCYTFVPQLSSDNINMETATQYDKTTLIA